MAMTARADTLCHTAARRFLPEQRGEKGRAGDAAPRCDPLFVSQSIGTSSAILARTRSTSAGSQPSGTGGSGQRFARAMPTAIARG